MSAINRKLINRNPINNVFIDSRGGAAEKMVAPFL